MDEKYHQIGSATVSVIFAFNFHCHVLLPFISNDVNGWNVLRAFCEFFEYVIVEAGGHVGRPRPLSISNKGRKSMTLIHRIFDGFQERGIFAWLPAKLDCFKYILDLSTKCVGRRVVEMGAGTGLWARILSQLGINVIAFDTFLSNHDSDSDSVTYNTKPDFFDVIKGSVSDLEKLDTRNDILLLAWPPLQNKMDTSSLKAFNGMDLIYIGELGGCTGSLEFCDVLSKSWKFVKVFEQPNSPMVKSCISHYQRI